MLSDPGDRSPAVTSRSIPPRLEQPRPSPAVSSRLQPSPAVSSRLKRPISQMTLFWAKISHAHGKKCPPERDCCSRWLPIPWGSSLDDVCDAPASQIPAGSAYPTSVHDRYEVTFDRYMTVADQYTPSPPVSAISTRLQPSPAVSSRLQPSRASS